MTPEQKAYAIISIISLGALAMLLWSWLVDEVFDWIARRYIEPWKERIRRKHES